MLRNVTETLERPFCQANVLETLFIRPRLPMVALVSGPSATNKAPSPTRLTSLLRDLPYSPKGCSGVPRWRTVGGSGNFYPAPGKGPNRCKRTSALQVWVIWGGRLVLSHLPGLGRKEAEESPLTIRQNGATTGRHSKAPG